MINSRIFYSIRVVVGLFFFLALSTHGKFDPTFNNLVFPYYNVENILNIPGAFIAGFFLEYFGPFSFLIPLYLLCVTAKSDKTTHVLLYGSALFLSLNLFLSIVITDFTTNPQRYLGAFSESFVSLKLNFFIKTCIFLFVSIHIIYIISLLKFDRSVIWGGGILRQTIQKNVFFIVVKLNLKNILSVKKTFANVKDDESLSNKVLADEKHNKTIDIEVRENKKNKKNIPKVENNIYKTKTLSDIRKTNFPDFLSSKDILLHDALQKLETETTELPLTFEDLIEDTKTKPTKSLLKSKNQIS